MVEDAVAIGPIPFTDPLLNNNVPQLARALNGLSAVCDVDNIDNMDTLH